MTSAAEPVIDATLLVKTFGMTRALDNLDLRVGPGEVHGFLGPNGAGKSTTLRVLLGLIRSTSGTARVFGLDPWRDPVRAHRDVAYVPGDVSLWPNLSGGEVIDEFDVDPADLAPVLQAVAASGISGLIVSPPSLESLFLSHYSDSNGQVR
ncbi:ABC-type Na+ transport system ATPase subunit NatA [Arthrobacter sp. UYNi723]